MLDADAPTLRDQIDALLKQVAVRVPPDVAKMMATELTKLAESGIASQSLQIGQTAPDFSLPGADGKSVHLAELLRHRSVVLTFYRGGWCPFCNLQLGAYEQILPALHGLGAELVAISPQTPDYTLTTVEEDGLTFPVLSDLGNRVATQYGLVYTLSDALKGLQRGFGNPVPEFNGDDSWRLPIPATFVIDRSGVVRLAFVDVDYTRRLEPASILEAVRQAK